MGRGRPGRGLAALLAVDAKGEAVLAVDAVCGGAGREGGVVTDRAQL